LPHVRLAEIEFIGLRGRSFRFSLTASVRGEIAVKRSHFDDALRQRAIEAGATVLQNTSVTSVEHGWALFAGGETFRGKILIAADGRNSTVARLLDLLPPAKKDRVALQTHL